ncbi:unnamed protein product [Durusdinium trenchii]|uniref:Uncharacterized protein n=2 Tax=Durusdinium trenchii TaxID=1381693 RepID=A0ABP0QXV0_9DINO
MPTFGQRTATQIIESVASNAPGETLDLTKNASFCMKSLENTIALSEALKKNTVIKTLVLRECEITDAGAEALGQALAENQTIEDLDLQQNHLSNAGVISLANGLRSNRSVKTLNLMTQNHKLSEDALEGFINMFQSNVTLTKLMWKVDSRRAWELSKLITRNVEIAHRARTGGDADSLAPRPAPTPVPAPVKAVKTVTAEVEKGSAYKAEQPKAAPGASPPVAPVAPVTSPCPSAGLMSVRGQGPLDLQRCRCQPVAAGSGRSPAPSRGDFRQLPDAAWATIHQGFQ